MTSKDPRQLSHFELHDLLGQGGMGEVYLALDTRLQRPVALKVMHSHIAKSETFRERFVKEARAIAALTHPHIVSVYSFDADKDGLYLVMEYFPNGSLRNYLRDRYEQGKLLDLSEVLLLISQIAAALDYAHKENMIHRDVKPDNVLLKSTPNVKTGDVEFSAVLTDFGLVKLAESPEFQTEGDNPLGTLPYMAPELIQGTGVDKRVDTYSLGIMFYELVAGRLPFRPQNLWEAGDMHIKQEPPRPSEFRPGISEKFEAIILKSIAKDPDDRYQSGREFIEALLELEGEESDFKSTLDSAALAEGRLDSLGTYLSSRPHISLERLFPSDVSEAIEADRLVIQPTDGEVFTIDVPTDTFTIGRSDGADIVLEDRKISKIHVRISRDADGNYVIQDLGSTNGTHLAGTKLLSQVEQAWQQGQTVRMGGHHIRFQKATQPALGSVAAVQATGETDAAVEGVSMFTVSDGESVGISFSPGTLTVDAGQRQSLSVEINNQSSLVEHYTLAIDGIPPAWVTVPPNPLQLLPGNSGVLTVHFHPPQSSKSKAGRHEFTIKALSQERDKEIGFSKGYLIINPFYEFRTDLDPQLIRQQGKMRFAILNRGNSPLNFEVSARDREAALVIEPREKSVTLEPGEGDVTEFRIELGPDIQIDSERTFSIEFRAIPDHGEEQTRHGELVATAAIPTGTLPYTVFDPQGGQHTLNLPTDMLAAELLTYIVGQIGLPAGDYHLANGKTGVQLPIGQTLAEAGIGMGGVVWVQGEAAPPEYEGPILTMRPRSLDFGSVNNQAVSEIEIMIRNTGDQELRGTIVPLVDWLEVVGTDVVRVGPGETISYMVRTRYVPFGVISSVPLIDVRTNAKNTSQGTYVVNGSFTAAWGQVPTAATDAPYSSDYGAAGSYYPPHTPTYTTAHPLAETSSWVNVLSVIGGIGVAIASILLIYSFFGLNWLGDGDFGISPFDIWRGIYKDIEFSLDFAKAVEGEGGFGAVRWMDRLLILLPFGAVIILLQLGFYMVNPSNRRRMALSMVILAVVLLILPFAWEQLSTQNWRGYIEGQIEDVGRDPSTSEYQDFVDEFVESGTATYNTDQFIAFAAFLLAVSVLLYGLTYIRFVPVTQGRGQMVLAGAGTIFAALLVFGLVLLLSDDEPESTAALNVPGFDVGTEDRNDDRDRPNEAIATVSNFVPTVAVMPSATPREFVFTPIYLTPTSTETPRFPTAILPTTTPTFTPEDAEATAEAVDEATEEVFTAEVTEEPTEEFLPTPEPTEEPTEEIVTTPEPTEEPAFTPEPTEEIEATPEPTDEVEETPESTEEPAFTPDATEEVEATPEVTEEPGPDSEAAEREGWAVFTGRGMQIELPEYWFELNLTGDMDDALDQAEDLYPVLEEQLDLIDRDPEQFRMLTVDPILSAVGYATNILVMMEEVPSDESLEEYLDETIEDLVDDFDAEIVEFLTIDSNDAILLEINQEVDGVNVRQYTYIITIDSEIWILTYSADRDAFRALESLFEYSVSTFRVID